MKKRILITASLLVILLLATLVGLSFCSEKQDVTTQTPPATSATIPSDPPTTDKPSTDQPVTDKPVTDKPVTDAPVTDAPVTYEPATGEHTHTVVVDAAVPATCTQTGLTEGKHCSDCGEVLVKQEVVPAKGHTEVIDAAKEPTCTQTGLTEGKHCSVCGEVLVKQTEIPTTPHTYVDENDTTCENCDHVRDCLHRETVTVNGKPATCTEAGLTDGKKCKFCGEITEAQKPIPAPGHTEVIDAAKAPTCTATGLTEGKHCSVCQAVLVKQEVIKATGHSLGAWTQTKAPTCTEKGEEKRTCKNCSYAETREIAAKGHTEVIDAAKAPTCTATGLTEGKHCSTCGTVLVKQEVIKATGHSLGAWTQTKAPTCTEKGEEKRTCKNCSYSETRDIAANGHTEVIDAAKAPTCTETGLTQGKHCSVCQAVLVKQEVIKATGHSLGAWTQTKAPTCTEKGEEKRTCKNCNHAETRDIAAKGHTEVIDAAKEPTCTATGLTQGKHCSTCGTVLVKQEVVKATGHSLGAWTQTKAPTCTEKGAEKRTCKNCSYAETREIAMTTHEFVNDVCKYCGAKTSVGLQFKLNSDGKSYYVSGIGSCTNTAIIIPSTYDGKPVTKIGYKAFYGCTSLTNITISDSVTSIGDWAF